MNVPIFKRVGCIARVRVATHADVALTKQVAFVFVANQHPEANVKFSIVNQERSLYVLLNYEHIRLYD